MEARDPPRCGQYRRRVPVRAFCAVEVVDHQPGQTLLALVVNGPQPRCAHPLWLQRVAVHGALVCHAASVSVPRSRGSRAVLAQQAVNGAAAVLTRDHLAAKPTRADIRLTRHDHRAGAEPAAEHTCEALTVRSPDRAARAHRLAQALAVPALDHGARGRMPMPCRIPRTIAPAGPQRPLMSSSRWPRRSLICGRYSTPSSTASPHR